MSERAHQALTLAAWVIIALMLGLVAHAALRGLDRAQTEPGPPLVYQPARDVASPAAPAARGYQPYCARPQTRDDAELCAQWAAVRATEEGNRLARTNMWVGAVEGVALVLSLLFTGWAAMAAASASRSAERAVHVAEKTAEAQLRAYAYIGQVSIKTVKDKYEFCATARNSGQTPALEFYLDMIDAFGTLPVRIDSVPQVPAAGPVGDVPPGEERTATGGLSKAKVDEALAKGQCLIIRVVARYRTIYSEAVVDEQLFTADALDITRGCCCRVDPHSIIPAEAPPAPYAAAVPNVPDAGGLEVEAAVLGQAPRPAV